MKGLLLPLVFLVLVIAVLISTGDRRPRADIVIAGENEVFTLDPQRMSYLADMRLAYALYEGLLRWNIEDFTLEPAAASDWSVDSTGRRFQFQLRPGARWSDGAPVTAQDFAWSWMRLLLPDTAADYSNLFFVIDGAQSFWDWRQAQLAAFVADPWQATDPDTRTRSTRAFLDRLSTLAEASDRPTDINWAVMDPGALAEEHAALEQALSSGENLSDVLDNSPIHRSLLAALDEPVSRQAEARWMWEQVEDRFASDVGITVEGPDQLVVELEQPVPYFPDLLAFAPASPVYRPAVEDWAVDADTRQAIIESGWNTVPRPSFDQRRGIDVSADTGRLIQSHRWARPGTLIGNGPYQLDEWRYKRDMRLSRSDTYHDPGMVGFDTIEIRSIPDPNTAVLSYLTGEVDWLTGVAADCRVDLLAQKARYEKRLGEGVDVEQLATGPVPGDEERRDIHAIPVFGTDFFSFNCRPQLADGRPNPFADPAVRRAFAQACDKESIVRNVTRLGEPVASTLVPPGSIPGYISPSGLGFDPDQARAQLAEAGWFDRDGDGRPENTDGVEFPDVEVLYTTGSPRFARMAVELRDQWQRHLGVPIVLLGQDTKFFKDDLRKGNFMVARGRWYGDYGDPTTFLELCRSSDGNNDRGFSNPDVDAALDAAAAETDPAKRLRDLSELEAMLFQQEMPLMPVCQLVDITMYDPARLTGVTHHPRLTHYLWNLQPRAEVQP
ncbi:MAG: peptide ABC transporter substrate-binding protein [Phycisphaerales bacterium]|nr:peptide ABC transporter substrate-binding protein [Phycisphaerales bacterium]